MLGKKFRELTAYATQSLADTTLGVRSSAYIEALNCIDITIRILSAAQQKSDIYEILQEDVSRKVIEEYIDDTFPIQTAINQALVKLDEISQEQTFWQSLSLNTLQHLYLCLILRHLTDCDDLTITDLQQLDLDNPDILTQFSDHEWISPPPLAITNGEHGVATAPDMLPTMLQTYIQISQNHQSLKNTDQPALYTLIQHLNALDPNVQDILTTQAPTPLSQRAIGAAITQLRKLNTHTIQKLMEKINNIDDNTTRLIELTACCIIPDHIYTLIDGPDITQTPLQRLLHHTHTQTGLNTTPYFHLAQYTDLNTKIFDADTPQSIKNTLQSPLLDSAIITDELNVVRTTHKALISLKQLSNHQEWDNTPLSKIQRIYLCLLASYQQQPYIAITELNPLLGIDNIQPYFTQKGWLPPSAQLTKTQRLLSQYAHQTQTLESLAETDQPELYTVLKHLNLLEPGAQETLTTEDDIPLAQRTIGAVIAQLRQLNTQTTRKLMRIINGIEDNSTKLIEIISCSLSTDYVQKIINAPPLFSLQDSGQRLIGLLTAKPDVTQPTPSFSQNGTELLTIILDSLKYYFITILLTSIATTCLAFYLLAGISLYSALFNFVALSSFGLAALQIASMRISYVTGLSFNKMARANHFEAKFPEPASNLPRHKKAFFWISSCFSSPDTPTTGPGTK